MKFIAQKSTLLLPFQNVRGSNFVLSQTSLVLTKFIENTLTSTIHNKYTTEYQDIFYSRFSKNQFCVIDVGTYYFYNFDHYISST